MSPVRLLVLIACAWTAYTIFQRAEMLRKRLDPRPDVIRDTYQGNWPIIIGMDVAGLAFVGLFIELYLNPGRISLGIVAVVLASGAASTILLVSMIAHNQREQGRRKARTQAVDDVVDMKAAVDEAVPAAIDRSLEGVVNGFRDVAPDHDRLIRVAPLPSAAPPA